MQIFLSLGSNLGKKKENLKQALLLLQKSGVLVVKKSSFYETGPSGVKNQPFFLNICVQAKTDLQPDELLQVCKKIEKRLGRKKRQKWGPREIDIDILFYGRRIITEKDLQIPHPRLPERKFVLVPLVEIAPNLIHPVLEKSVKQLLRKCRDKGIVRKDG